MSEPITVITLTRKRPSLLRRAIESVRLQDYRGEVEHLIVIDDDAAALDVISTMESSPGRQLVAHLEPRPASENGTEADSRASVYPRLARLLNLGVELARSPWIAFLDDDNLYEPDHLSSLADCALASGSKAVHSARQMVNQDGSPYLLPFFPGAATAEEGARIFELMCEREVWVRGTNVLRDRIEPSKSSFRNSTVMGPADPVSLVDQNLWLIRRELLLRHPIPEQWSDADVEANTCPDDKMLERLVRANVRIVSSGLPTVRYFVGGISNGDGPTNNG